MKEQQSNFKYIEYLCQNTLVINHPVQKSNTGKAKEIQNKETFRFDRVFNIDDSQEVIYEEISQLVRSALDGYKVCIFAYGQTGSGKTFTMQGDRERPGIIPRSVTQIFEEKKELEKSGWKITLEVSYLEIYVDQVRDLLLNNSNNVISQNSKIGNAFTPIINNIEDMNNLIETATKKRVVAETLCNDRSSRSHLIFQLKINAKNAELKVERNGALNLIDLAGSERISKSKVEDERLKESIAINKSLSNLKTVITALVNSTGHVPYRSSVLTTILQPHLGGDSKTLMFVNISPLVSNLGETTNSLKFALDVNNCYIKE
jgi:kinesin family protein C1